MQRRIPQHDKDPTEHRQAPAIPPQREIVEAERRQDSGARDLDVEAVLFVDEGEGADFVYDEAFEGVVENGELEES